MTNRLCRTAFGLWAVLIAVFSVHQTVPERLNAERFRSEATSHRRVRDASFFPSVRLNMTEIPRPPRTLNHPRLSGSLIQYDSHEDRIGLSTPRDLPPLDFLGFEAGPNARSLLVTRREDRRVHVAILIAKLFNVPENLVVQAASFLGLPKEKDLGSKVKIDRSSAPNVFSDKVDLNIKPVETVALHRLWVGLNCNPSALGIFCNSVRFAHGIGGFARVFHGFAREHDLPQQESRADAGDPETPLCPKCAIFGGVGRLPLGTKVAFAFPLWIAAWGAVLEGLGAGLSRRRRLHFGWLGCGIAIGLIPFFAGIV